MTVSVSHPCAGRGLEAPYGIRQACVVVALLLSACATQNPPTVAQNDVATVVLPSHRGLRHTAILRVDGTLRSSSFLGLGADHSKDPLCLAPGEHILRIHETAGTLHVDLDLNFVAKASRIYQIHDHWAGAGFAVWVEDEPGHSVFATRVHDG
jgi:hypothetical protein